MENKKYIRKKEDSVVESFDGTENKEHIFDMIDRTEMCIENIQNNTDICMSVFKIEQARVDEDEGDALQLLCQDCIEIEAESCEVLDEIEIIKEKIDKHLGVSEAKVEDLLKKALILDLRSEQLVEKIIKK